MRLLHSLPLLGVLAGCQPATTPAAHTPPAPLPATAPAATLPPSANTPAIARIELGNALGSDQRVLAPMLRFAPSDTIYASLVLSGQSPTPHRLDARWSHLDSKQTVLAESKTLVFNGNAVTTFQISRPNGWPAGHYKLELLLDQMLVQTRLFEVDAPLPAASVASVR